MAKGGARPGAGRKPGVSKVTLIKRQIQDHFSDDEVMQLIKDAKKMARKKPEIMKFLLEQIFGKAPQRMELTGEDGEPIAHVVILPPRDAQSSSSMGT